MKIHLVRHFPANKIISAEAEKTFGSVKGGILRPLDTQRTAVLGPRFRTLLANENPHFILLGHSPTVRTAATLLIGTVGLANEAPIFEVPELYWNDETIAGIMPDFKVHDVDTSKYSPEGLEALDRLGKEGASGIRRLLAQARMIAGDALFVGHGPLTAATAYHLAGTDEAKRFCLSVLSKEGSRFVVENAVVRFVPLE